MRAAINYLLMVVVCSGGAFAYAEYANDPHFKPEPYIAWRKPDLITEYRNKGMICSYWMSENEQPTKRKCAAARW